MREWFRSHPFVLLLIPLIAVIIFYYSYWQPRQTQPVASTDKQALLGIVEDYPSERAKTWRYTIRLAHERAYVYIRKDSTVILPSMGDTLLLFTTIERPDSLGDFDYAGYLRRQGIAGIAFVHDGEWRIVGHATHPQSIRQWARWTQHRLVQQYKDFGISQEAIGSIAALSLGYKEDLDDDIQRAFQHAGATHILAVSGLHTGIIVAILWALLTCFDSRRPLYEQRGRRKVIAITIIVLMWMYAFITGLSPSVVRAVIMVSIAQCAYMCYRNPISLNSVAAAAFLILCFRPMDLFSVSFQLSFAAVTAILILEPYIRLLFPELTSLRGFTKRAYVFTRGLISVSLAAQIGTLPLTLFYFGQTSLYFLLTNMIVIPVATILLWLVVAFFALGWIKIIGALLASLLDIFATFMNTSVHWIEQLPGCVSHLSINATMVFIYYVAVVFAYLAFKRSYWWFLAVTLSTGLFCLVYFTLS